MQLVGGANAVNMVRDVKKIVMPSSTIGIRMTKLKLRPIVNLPVKVSAMIRVMYGCVAVVVAVAEEAAVAKEVVPLFLRATYK